MNQEYSTRAKGHVL